MNGLKSSCSFVAVLVVGQVTDWGVADHLALALLVLLAVAWLWTRLSLRGVSVVRKTGADRAQVGQSLRETLAVRNAGRLGKLWVELLDRSTLPGHDPGRVVTVPGRSAVEWDTRTVCVRRGRYHLGPIELRSGDPLGIFTSRLDFAETAGGHRLPGRGRSARSRHPGGRALRGQRPGAAHAPRHAERRRHSRLHGRATPSTASPGRPRRGWAG